MEVVLVLAGPYPTPLPEGQHYPQGRAGEKKKGRAGGPAPKDIADK